MRPYFITLETNKMANKIKRAAQRIEQEQKFIKMNWEVIKKAWPHRNIAALDTPKRCILRAIAGIKACKEEIKRLSK